MVVGAAAVSVALSPWLIAFFLFLALAIVKRQGEQTGDDRQWDASQNCVAGRGM